MNNRIRGKIEEYVRTLRWTPKDYYWKHSFLVRDFALMIHQKVGGDRDVVEVSALLHDIGKAKLLARSHEKFSTELTKKFLEKIEFDKNKIKKIVECIEYENFSSIEARILRSADSMGLIMDDTGGKEWFFKNILKNENKQIVKELEKSYSEIEFEFARKLTEKAYKKLIDKYKQ
jgi:putative nucleotidyltransferase with HDIG domain